MDAANAERDAAALELSWARQQALAQTWSAWLEAVGSKQLVDVRERALAAAEVLLRSTEARASEGLISQIDADVVRAEVSCISAERDAAIARAATARANLRRLIGVEPELPREAEVTGPDLAEVDLGRAGEAAAERADVRTLEALVRARRALASLERRRRVPSPSVFLFAAEDGFHERVIGGGLSLPLYVPGFWAPNGSGDVQTADAEADAAQARLDGLRARAEAEIRAGIAELRARQDAMRRFDPGLVARSRTHLARLQEALGQGQLSARDAVIAERALLDVEAAAIEARLAEAQARVALALSLGRLAEEVSQ